MKPSRDAARAACGPRPAAGKQRRGGRGADAPGRCANVPRVIPAPSVSSPRAVRLAFAASALLSLWFAWRVPLLDPDEGRNAEVAREMAASGDVVIPHLGGMPYLDKPPGLFAAGALAVRAFGANRVAVRLPALVASLVTLWLLARAARRLARAPGEPGDGHDLDVVLLTASAPLFAPLAAYVIFDMPLAACVTAVWTGVALETATGRSNGRRLAMFAAVAIGVLLKGPVMLAWAIGGSAGAALLVRSRAPLAWLAWAPGWLAVLALAGGWFALALRRHPEYARYAFLEESLERLTSRSFAREQPWWFVPAVLAGGALPWSLATPWRAPRSPSARIAAGFVLFAAVFFTFSRSKLVTYLLPAIPALAWWGAACWRERAGRLPRPLLAGLLLAPLLMTAGSPWVVRYARTQSGEPLAEAVARAGAATVLYDNCYSPGSDFRLGRLSEVVSEGGHVLTSNYVVRYRDSLEARGLWRFHPSVEAAPATDVVVLPARARAEGRERWGDPLFENQRFVAFRRGAAR